MALTKEECRKALNNTIECLKMSDCRNCDYYNHGKCSNGNKDFDIMKKLINEHFDNPPLKLEEIQKMAIESETKEVVIFDDKDKCHIRMYIDDEGDVYYFHFGNECESLFVFEDNRFYRREVMDL